MDPASDRGPVPVSRVPDGRGSSGPLRRARRRVRRWYRSTPVRDLVGRVVVVTVVVLVAAGVVAFIVLKGGQ